MRKIGRLLRAAAGHWRDIAGASAAEAANLIRRDRIDMLVDLSGFTAKNRLALFALRAAPVQVTWLGYFGTTGLTSMDYILADRFVVAGGEEQYFTESVWRLPDSYLCFTPPSLDIAVALPPATANGYVTFGCFNKRAKITPETIEVWGALLRSVPDARLFLKTGSLADPTVRYALVERFAALGVEADRLILEGPAPRAELLAAYGRMDIALDPFPFGGGTTTAEALWMGVPSWCCAATVGWGGSARSILATIGVPELVAGQPGRLFGDCVRPGGGWEAAGGAAFGHVRGPG